MLLQQTIFQLPPDKKQFLIVTEKCEPTEKVKAEGTFCLLNIRVSALWVMMSLCQTDYRGGSSR